MIQNTQMIWLYIYNRRWWLQWQWWARRWPQIEIDKRKKPHGEQLSWLKYHMLWILPSHLENDVTNIGTSIILTDQWTSISLTDFTGFFICHFQTQHFLVKHRHCKYIACIRIHTHLFCEMRWISRTLSHGQRSQIHKIIHKNT